MRNKLLITVLLLSTTMLFAQNKREATAERIESQKIAFITQKLNLNTQESQSFWPVYNEYNDALSALKKEKNSGSVKLSENISDADAKELITKNLAYAQDELDLKKEYVRNLEAVLPMRKIALLFHAEAEFKRTMLNKIKRRYRRQNRNN